MGIAAAMDELKARLAIHIKTLSALQETHDSEIRALREHIAIQDAELDMIWAELRTHPMSQDFQCRLSVAKGLIGFKYTE